MSPFLPPLLAGVRSIRLFLLGAAFAALTGSLAAQSAPPPAQKKAPPSIGEKTSEAFQKLRPLQEKQDFNGMLAVLEAVPVQANSYDEALVLDMKAKIFAMTNQLSKAIAPWEKAIELSDKFEYFPEKQTLETVVLLAQLYGQEGSSSKDPKVQQQSFAKAITYFKRYLDKTKKPTPETLMAYASILYYRSVADPNNIDRAGLAEAQKVVERGLLESIKPREGFYQLMLTLLQQQNDLRSSAEYLELLLAQNADKKDFWQLLMASYLQLSEKSSKEDPNLSREYLIRAIVTCERAQAKGHMKTPKDSMNLVSLYLMAGQFSRGTEILYQGMKKGEIESEPNNWRVLGRYYLEANMNEQAIKVLKEAAGLFPTKGEIEMQIAQIYTQMENNRDSLKHAKLAVQKGNFEGTKPFSAHYLIAYTAYDLGEIDEAKAAIEKASSFEESKKDGQFPRLKAVIEEAIAEREAKKSEKAPKAKS